MARIYEHTSLCLGSSGDHCIRLRLQQGEILHFDGQDNDAVATPGFSIRKRLKGRCFQQNVQVRRDARLLIVWHNTAVPLQQMLDMPACCFCFRQHSLVVSCVLVDCSCVASKAACSAPHRDISLLPAPSHLIYESLASRLHLCFVGVACAQTSIACCASSCSKWHILCMLYNS